MTSGDEIADFERCLRFANYNPSIDRALVNDLCHQQLQPIQFANQGCLFGLNREVALLVGARIRLCEDQYEYKEGPGGDTEHDCIPNNVRPIDRGIEVRHGQSHLNADQSITVAFTPACSSGRGISLTS